MDKPLTSAKRTLVYPPRSGDWPKEDILTLVKMYNEGKSMSAIGNQVGRSRNAVAGQIHKIRIKRLHELHPREDKYTNNKVKTVATVRSIPKTFTVTPSKEKPRIRLQLIENDKAVTFQELGKHHCRYPLGDPKRSDFRFCGCSRVDGKSYCQEHINLTGRHYEKVA